MMEDQVVLDDSNILYPVPIRGLQCSLSDDCSLFGDSFFVGESNATEEVFDDDCFGIESNIVGDNGERKVRAIAVGGLVGWSKRRGSESESSSSNKKSKMRFKQQESVEDDDKPNVCDMPAMKRSRAKSMINVSCQRIKVIVDGKHDVSINSDRRVTLQRYDGIDTSFKFSNTSDTLSTTTPQEFRMLHSRSKSFSPHLLSQYRNQPFRYRPQAPFQPTTEFSPPTTSNSLHTIS
eukprot:m.75853 g.75853  ORF g.75853 m.75853 type:complete len:235 (-) comp8498_c1_seq2:2467-3171(-)